MMTSLQQRICLDLFTVLKCRRESDQKLTEILYIFIMLSCINAELRVLEHDEVLFKAAKFLLLLHSQS